MKIDDFLLWLIALLGGMAMVGARLGYQLFGIAPQAPADPTALKLWRSKRLWLIISEFSALPAFATIALLVGRLQSWSPESVVVFTMVLGALGFAFFLDALNTVARRKIGMKDAAPRDKQP